MKKITKNNEKGFTIIEVVLVLAIAGLIFLVVFLALPQLQRSRRDTQRKSDAGRGLAALESYSGNNNGSYPKDIAAFKADVLPAYLATETDPVTGALIGWSDPSTGLVYSEASAAPATITTLTEGQYWYQTNATCDGQTFKAGDGRDIVFIMFQESGGQYCQDNQ